MPRNALSASMQSPRIYLSRPLQPGTTVELDARAARHVVQVLRLRAGDAVTLFDGEGGQWQARLTRVARAGVLAEIGDFQDIEVESPLSIVLAQGISRGERMDYTIRKAVELGVTAIVPLVTERTQVKLTGDRLDRRMNHWLGIIIAACEQCGRNRLPALLPMRSLGAWLKETRPGGHRLMLDPRGDTDVAGLGPPVDRFCLLIGPEGGFSESERQAAGRAGYAGLRLGPRVLRTETAALAAIAALQATCGDFRQPDSSNRPPGSPGP